MEGAYAVDLKDARRLVCNNEKKGRRSIISKKRLINGICDIFDMKSNQFGPVISWSNDLFSQTMRLTRLKTHLMI